MVRPTIPLKTCDSRKKQGLLWKEVDALNSSIMKILGIAATIIGMGASLLGEFISEKKTDAKIEEKVSKALADR